MVTKVLLSAAVLPQRDGTARRAGIPSVSLTQAAFVMNSALAQPPRCGTGVPDADASLQRRDCHSAAVASMLRRHLAELQAEPQVQPHGMPLLSEGFRRRLECHRLTSAVCIQARSLQSAPPVAPHTQTINHISIQPPEASVMKDFHSQIGELIGP